MNAPVTAPSAEIALPPVARVNCAGLTVMAGLVLAVLLPSLRSLAVMVKLPLVLKRTVTVCVPETRAVSIGSVAVASVEVMPTVSVTVFTRFQLPSTALTVTLTSTPANCALGVPVLPLAVPGAAVSPGTSSWSFAKAAGLTTMLPEVAPVRPLALKLRLMVLATLWDRLAKVAMPLTAVAV